jgi:DNA replication protein DnaC
MKMVEMENQPEKLDPAKSTTPTPPAPGSFEDLRLRCQEALDITPEQQANIDASEARRLREEVSKRRATAMVDLIRQCGVRYSDVSFENYDITCDRQREIIKDLRSRIHEVSRQGILLFGPSGTGKDHLLIALAREASYKGVESFCWVNGQDLFSAGRDRMDGDQSEMTFILQYTQPQVLILSDPVPVSGKLTDFQLNLLYRIVDRRYRACRATWVSMNVDGPGMAEERLGVAIVDRLRHDAQAHFCNWPSYRTTLTEET